MKTLLRFLLAVTLSVFATPSIILAVAFYWGWYLQLPDDEFFEIKVCRGEDYFVSPLFYRDDPCAEYHFKSFYHFFFGKYYKKIENIWLD